MNPYKKIERLQKRVDALEKENDQLRWAIKDNEKLKEQCEVRMLAANKKELEYYKLIADLEQDRLRYKKLINTMKGTVKGVNSTYKKAFNNIKKDFKEVE